MKTITQYHDKRAQRKSAKRKKKEENLKASQTSPRFRLLVLGPFRSRKRKRSQTPDGLAISICSIDFHFAAAAAAAHMHLLVIIYTKQRNGAPNLNKITELVGVREGAASFTSSVTTNFHSHHYMMLYSHYSRNAEGFIIGIWYETDAHT